MPRKLDFSKVKDISLEDSKETTDIRSVVNNLLPTKLKFKDYTIEKEKDTLEQTHALSHVSTPIPSSISTPILSTSSFEEITIPAIDILNNELKESKLKETESFSEPTVKDMAKWHTEAEQKVYKAMVSETKKEGTLELYFSFQQLSRKTGFQNRRTIIAAISGLLAKQSVSVIIDQHGDHHGKCYKVFLPKEILERRRELKVQIHPQTKKIL